MRLFKGGWYLPSKRESCRFFNQRPSDEISLLVIHCISLPEGVFGTGCVERLFAGCLDCKEHESFNDLSGLEVSSHFFIDRCGEVKQFVSVNDRAWHAGVSVFQGRENCNDYSVGIELEGTDCMEFTAEQYQALTVLSASILECYSVPIENIVGHSDIAPGRKTDPGSGFDWTLFRASLQEKIFN